MTRLYFSLVYGEKVQNKLQKFTLYPKLLIYPKYYIRGLFTLAATIECLAYFELKKYVLMVRKQDWQFFQLYVNQLFCGPYNVQCT